MRPRRLLLTLACVAWPLMAGGQTSEPFNLEIGDPARPLLAGQVPSDILIHIMALAATAGLAFTIALALTRRRLLK